MALVSQDNIPQSGQIQKPTNNPSQGNSNIQANLQTPPSQGTTDNFQNPTQSETWKSAKQTHSLNNGLGQVIHGLGVPDTTIAWNVANSGQSITMDYSPVGSSRIQENLTNSVYHIMSKEAQRGWSGPRASLWNSEPHIITRPDETEAVVAGNEWVDKLQEFGIAISYQDAVRYGRHLLSPRGLQFLNTQNVLTNKAEELRKQTYYIDKEKIEAGEGKGRKPLEDFKELQFNPLAIYVSRALPAQMVRYTDAKYSAWIDALVGGSPLRSLAIGGLKKLAKDAGVNLPIDFVAGQQKKFEAGEITIGEGLANVALHLAEGKVIEKAQQYGQKLLDKWNKKEKGKTVDKTNAEPTKDKDTKIPPLKPSEYSANKPYVRNFSVRADGQLWGGLNEQERFTKISLGSQILNWHMTDSEVMDKGTPLTSVQAWKDWFRTFGINYTTEADETFNNQWGTRTPTIPVGLNAEILGPSNEGDQKGYKTHIDPANDYEGRYSKFKTDDQFDNRKKLVDEDITKKADGGISAPDNTGTLVTQVNLYNQDTKYDSIDKEAKQEAKHDKLHDGIYDGTSLELSPLEAPVDNTGAKFMTKNWNHGDKKYKATGDPVLDTDTDGNVGITQVGVNIPENKIIRKTALQTSHIDGKSPDKDGNYSKGGTEIIDKYKGHLYSEIAEKRNPANVTTWSRNRVHPVTGLSHTKMGTAGRAAPGDVYLGDVINSREIEKLNSLDESGQAADDSIVFKIKIMNTKELIVLRAFLDEIGDSVTPNWSAINYIGKPDPVYVYKGAERKVSLGFSLVTFTAEEHTHIWTKANKLLALNYPTYAKVTGGGKRMVPPMIRLTVGDYISDQPGFFENINITPKDNTPWEVEKGKQLPLHLDVKASFTYIGDSMPDLENPKLYNVNGLQKGTS